MALDMIDGFRRIFADLNLRCSAPFGPISVEFSTSNDHRPASTHLEGMGIPV